MRHLQQYVLLALFWRGAYGMDAHREGIREVVGGNSPGMAMQRISMEAREKFPAKALVQEWFVDKITGKWAVEGREKDLLGLEAVLLLQQRKIARRAAWRRALGGGGMNA